MSNENKKILTAEDLKEKVETRLEETKEQTTEIKVDTTEATENSKTEQKVEDNVGMVVTNEPSPMAECGAGAKMIVHGIKAGAKKHKKKIIAVICGALGIAGAAFVGKAVLEHMADEREALDRLSNDDTDDFGNTDTYVETTAEDFTDVDDAPTTGESMDE